MSAIKQLIRLNKLLAQKGLCSRREADTYIAKGLVRVNGLRIDQLGTKVSETDSVELLSKAINQQASKQTLLYNKPLGIVSCQPERADQTPAIQLCTQEMEYSTASHTKRRMAPCHQSRWAVAGRLDVNSTGLLVLTQNGTIASRLIGNESNMEKEYLVRLDSSLFNDDRLEDKLDTLRDGIEDKGELLIAKSVSVLNEDQLQVVLTAGKHHHIRRMMHAVNWNTQALKRVRIGKIMLGDLPLGHWRYLLPHERF
jgi:23S rRNA pseudouridine2604 synthase